MKRILILTIICQITFTIYAQKKILMEEFTTMGEIFSAQYNPPFDSLIKMNKEKVTIVKYQLYYGMNPLYDYNPTDVTGRKNYYLVPGVPQVYINGSYWSGTINNFTQGKIDSAYDSMQDNFMFEVGELYIKNSDSLFVTISTKALVANSETDLKLHTVLLEDSIGYSSAPGTNGETDFKWVMRKMNPSYEGTSIGSQSLNEENSYTMGFKIDPIFNLDELSIVAFIQDESSKEVLASQSISLDTSCMILGNKICMVTVDSATNKNLVVWDKESTSNLNYFKIYKESNQAGQYDSVGVVLANQLSTFVDDNSNPLQKAERYKISTYSTCDYESGLSPTHKTCHLTISAGQNGAWNLIWDHYEGFSFSTYDIYRGTSGSNMELIGSVASTISSYTDLNPPSGDLIYQIALTNSTGCNPTAKTSGYDMVKSNIASTNPTGIKTNNTVLSELTIYPNPVNNETAVIKFNNDDKKSLTIKVINTLGEEVWSRTTTSNNVKFENGGSITTGLYFVRVQEKNEIIGSKVLLVQ